MELYYEGNADFKNYFYVDRAINNSCFPHFHSSIEIIFVISGEHRVVINSQEYLLSPGDISITNKFDVHNYHYVGGSEIYVILLGQEMLEHFNLSYKNMFFDKVLRKTGDSNLEISKIIEMMAANKSQNDIIRLGLANVLIGTLMKYYNLRHASVAYDRAIIRILNYVNDNYANELSCESLAKEFGYNVKYFSRLFNKNVRMHFNDYLNQLRLYKVGIMKSAKQNEKAKLSDVVFSCGFDSMNTYYRSLKKYNSVDSISLNQ